MRLFFALYAAAVIGMLYLQQHDGLANAVLWSYGALWIAGLVAVAVRVTWSSWVGLACLVPLLGFLLFQAAARATFIVQYGGMDCATCNGSPMAFLLAWLVELVFLIPGMFLCWWLVPARRD